MPEKKSCLDTALALLARREHAVKELEAKLLGKKYAPAEVTEVIEKLTEKRLLSDERYAEARVRYRAEISGWGPARIRQELLARGVSSGVASACIDAALVLHACRFDGAKRLIRAHARHIEATPADPALGGREKLAAKMKAREKLLAKLQRKGFSYAEARAAIDEAEANNPE